MREKAEIAILGAGFSGSLLALLLKQTGREVILIEKGTHPRFAIGESSTPLANLVFENICRTYDLHPLLPLTKFGSWQRSYPELPCGLKRGFSFFKHTQYESFKPQKDHSNELLVAASPADDVGDTHWYREEFDHFLIKEVQKARVPYFDQTTITAIENNHGWKFYGNRLENEVEIDADRRTLRVVAHEPVAAPE